MKSDQLVVCIKYPKSKCKKVIGGYVIYCNRYDKLTTAPAYNEDDAWKRAREIIEKETKK